MYKRQPEGAAPGVGPGLWAVELVAAGGGCGVCVVDVVEGLAPVCWACAGVGVVVVIAVVVVMAVVVVAGVGAGDVVAVVVGVWPRPCRV